MGFFVRTLNGIKFKQGYVKFRVAHKLQTWIALSLTSFILP